LPSSVVLDSSAILAVFLSEPGCERVLPFLQGALLSTVNLAEVITRMIDVGAAGGHVWSRVESVQCEVCPFTVGQARIAAELRPITSPFGLSLGDRACLALAIDRKATVYTTDKTWKKLSLGIEIEAIR
jgi:PIN domain nuclease of toxin-antitoxin system